LEFHPSLQCFFTSTLILSFLGLPRLASNRCVWGVPPAYSGRGAPCKHGHKFKLNAPETWSVADTTIEITDPKIGRVRVTHWRDFHFRTSPERPMQIFRVEVIEPLGRNRKFQPMWLGWVKLGLLWRLCG